MFHALDIFVFGFSAETENSAKKNDRSGFTMSYGCDSLIYHFQIKLPQFCILFIIRATHSMWICVVASLATTTTTQSHLHIHMANSHTHIMYCFRARQFLAYSFDAIVGGRGGGG